MIEFGTDMNYPRLEGGPDTARANNTAAGLRDVTKDIQVHVANWKEFNRCTGSSPNLSIAIYVARWGLMIASVFAFWWVYSIFHSRLLAGGLSPFWVCLGAYFFLCGCG